MAMEYEKFTANANKAVRLNLVRDGKNIFEKPIHPAFMDSFFNEEVIVGYKDPKIRINFRAHDMKPTVKISYSNKIQPDSKEVAVEMDLEEKLRPFLPEGTLGLEEDTAGASSEITDETPPGECMHKYRDDGNDFEVWCASLDDPDAHEVLENFRILIPMFIEGGTTDFIDGAYKEITEWSMRRWKVFLLYQVHDNRYNFVGFTTTYRLWVFPAPSVLEFLPQGTSLSTKLLEGPNLAAESDILSSPSRERIAQFFILPPFQRRSHGMQLYNTAMEHFLADPYVFEVTVEEPNDHFDNLRDYCDLYRLEALPLFSTITLPTSIPAESLLPEADMPIELFISTETINALRRSQKLNERQLRRLIELHLLGQISPTHRSKARITKKAASIDSQDRAYYFWRLLVKHRVYERNRDELEQIDESERLARVEASVASLQEGYEALLIGYARRLKSGLLGPRVNWRDSEAGKLHSRTNGKKRKLIVIEDDSGDEMMTEPAAKKLAMSAATGDVGGGADAPPA